MKKIILTCSFFIFYFLFFVQAVHADYATALSAYNAQYTQYRTDYSRFTVARSTYQTYRTLAAQNSALTAFKTVLAGRNNLMGAYFDLLQEKLSETPEVDQLDVDAYSEIRTATKDWLAGNQAKVASAGTIDDLNDISDEFADRYPQMLLESKQTIGRVLLAKGTALDKKLLAEIDSMGEVIKRVSQAGEDTMNLDRGLIQTRTKRDLFVQKQNQVRGTFFPQERYNQEVDLLTGQQLAIEANQYLREATNYLLELIKTITG